ncbi:MAG: glycosyltransferase family 2 protein [Bacteroidetes bacterium]|nr:glycosyltransferase family 2 protein [Bacteroidota bacterium]
MDLTIAIPLLDEEESLPELVAWIARVAQAEGYSYEILLVDDGSKDRSWEVIRHLQATYPSVRGIRFQRNYGKSAALNVAFARAQGRVVITMDADLQDSPDEIPALYRLIMEDGYDLVSGWKKVRHDPVSKTIPSKFFNRITRWITGIRLNDFNCGLKAYRKEVIKSIEVYGEMHRYIPYLAKGAGFRKIGEKVVSHRARKYGRSKFGLERFINGFLDLLSISFMTRFGRRPMHFFGSLGILAFLAGFFVTAWLVVLKVCYATGLLGPDFRMRDIVDQPLFYLALVCIILGVQLFLAGFLGELITRSASDRNRYLVADEI